MKTADKKIFGFVASYGGQILPNKKWFVAYYTPDYSTGKLKKHKYYGEINKYDEPERRMAECYKIKGFIESGHELPNLRGARRIQQPDLPVNFASAIYCLHKALDSRKPLLKPKTYTDYVSIIKTLDAFLNKKGVKNISVAKVDEALVEEFLAYLLECGYSNKYYNNVKITLGSLWDTISRKLAAKIKLDNPWKKFRTLKKMTVAYEPYNHELEQLISEELPKYDMQVWLFVQMTHYCMIRGTESRKLRIDHIDFYNHTITIPADIAKNKKKRIVAIPVPLYNYMMDIQLHRYYRDSYIFGKGGTPSSQPLSINHLRNQYNKFKEIHNIPKKYKIYAWKHTGNIKLDKAGVSLKDIQLQNGHHSLDQLNDYLASMNNKAPEKLKNHFPKIGSIATDNLPTEREKILLDLIRNGDINLLRSLLFPDNHSGLSNQQ